MRKTITKNIFQQGSVEVYLVEYKEGKGVYTKVTIKPLHGEEMCNV